MQIIEIAAKIINRIEQTEAPILQFVFIFLFSVLIRNFLEIFAYHQFTITELYPQLHYTAYYLAIGLAYILILHFITRTPIINVSKVILIFFPIIIICPALDLIFSQFGLTYDLGYLTPTHGNLLQYLITFFGEHRDSMGPSLGYRIEIGFIILFSLIFIYTKTKSLLKTLIGGSSIYLIIFFFCSTPYFLELLFKSNNNTLIIPYYVNLFLILLLIFLFKLNKSYFTAIVQDIRLPRLIHFELMFICGLIYGNFMGGQIFPKDILYLLIILWSIGLAWLHAVMTNNIEDLEIDNLSNPSRPLINNSIAINHYKIISWFVLVTALLLSALAQFSVFLVIIIFALNYSIYSCKPIRLKRIPILSKLPISVNSLLLILLGFSVTGIDISDVPSSIYLFLLIGFTLAINFIDIKDFKGDKAAGIKTLPVILGLKSAKLIIALIFVALHLCSYFFLQNVFLFLLIAGLGGVQFYFITCRKYKDRNVVLLYLLAFSIFMADNISTVFFWEKPQNVIEKYTRLINQRAFAEAFYFISEDSKKFTPKQEFINFYSGSDQFEKILSNPQSVALPDSLAQLKKYRKFAITGMNIVGTDTSEFINYSTLINENQKWKILWINKIKKVAEVKLKKKNFQEAFNLYHKILEIDPCDGESHFKFGRCYRAATNNWQTDQVVENHFKQAIELEPEISEYYNDLAIHYSELNKFELSIEYFQKAIERSNSLVQKRDYSFNIASIYLNLGEFAAAQESIQNTIDLDPRYTASWYIQGIIQIKLESIDEAYNSFKKAIQLDPMNNSVWQRELYHNYINVCTALGKMDEAKTYHLILQNM